MKILKFYTPTCMSCRVLSKSLDKLENVEIISVDATEELEKERKRSLSFLARTLGMAQRHE